jgi:hypothetical protein
MKRSYLTTTGLKRWLYGSAALAIAITAGCADGTDDIAAATTTRRGATTNAYQEFLLVPSYIDLGRTDLWAAAMPTYPAGYYSNFVISGPPGPSGFAQPPAPNDPNVTNGNLQWIVNTLHASGARALGYVTWKQSYNRTSSDIKADIDAWHNLGVGLDGILFDDAERSDTSILASIEWLGNYAQDTFAGTCMSSCPGTVVFNWGGASPTMENYVDCQLAEQSEGWYAQLNMIWVTFEGSEFNYLYGTNWTDTNHNWIHNLWANRFANLVYSGSADGSRVTGMTSYYQQQSWSNALWIYATNTGGSPANTWGTIASNPLWSDEQQYLAGQANTFAGADDWNEVYNWGYGGGACPSPAL